MARKRKLSLNVRERAKAEAKYICETDVTIRECAGVFCVCKSTVWTDITYRLDEENDKELITNLKAILKKHWENRQINGGQATKMSWQLKRFLAEDNHDNSN